MNDSDIDKTAIKGNTRKNAVRFLPSRIHFMAGKVFRQIDSMCNRAAGRTDEMTKSTESTATNSTALTNSENVSLGTGVCDISNYSPIHWNISEHPTDEPIEVSQFISLAILASNHRAGSTLLQRICNVREKTLIWGEHNALLRHYAAIYEDVVKFAKIGGEERENYFAQSENPNLWTASMCPSLEFAQRGIIKSARRFLREFYGQYCERYDIIGFKEVQYGRNELELLLGCYPDIQILFIVRDPLKAWKSTPPGWYPSLDDWIQKWNSRVQCFRMFSADNANCHLIRYEDLIRKDRKILEIIGDAAQVTERQIQTVLARKVGGKKGVINKSDKTEICRRCRIEMEAMGYI